MIERRQVHKHQSFAGDGMRNHYVPEGVGRCAPPRFISRNGRDLFTGVVAPTTCLTTCLTTCKVIP